MLEHIVQLDPKDFIDIDDADTPSLLAGQASTATFLASLGSPEEMITADQAHNARMAFAAVTNASTPENERRNAILALRVPPAVKHLAVMLGEYDWDFVEQAKEIRSYVVAGLLDESKHPDPKIRLKAYQMLGNVTEVGAFTERVEITKKTANVDELVTRVRERLQKMLPPAAIETVQDVEVKDAGPDSAA